MMKLAFLVHFFRLSEYVSNALSSPMEAFLNAFQLVFFYRSCVFEFFGKKKSLERKSIDLCFLFGVTFCCWIGAFFPRIVFIVSHDLEQIIWLPIICLELFPPRWILFGIWLVEREKALNDGSWYHAYHRNGCRTRKIMRANNLKYK